MVETKYTPFQGPKYINWTQIRVDNKSAELELNYGYFFKKQYSDDDKHKRKKVIFRLAL